jgi:hypothetical protein
MRKTTITVPPFVGFAAESVKAGEPIRVLHSYTCSTDDPRFYMFLNQIDESFLVPAGIDGDTVTKFLVVQHADNSADVYTDYSVILRGKHSGG